MPPLRGGLRLNAQQQTPRTYNTYKTPLSPHTQKHPNMENISVYRLVHLFHHKQDSLWARLLSGSRQADSAVLRSIQYCHKLREETREALSQWRRFFSDEKAPLWSKTSPRADLQEDCHETLIDQPQHTRRERCPRTPQSSVRMRRKKSELYMNAYHVHELTLHHSYHI